MKRVTLIATAPDREALATQLEGAAARLRDGYESFMSGSGHSGAHYEFDIEMLPNQIDDGEPSSNPPVDEL